MTQREDRHPQSVRMLSELTNRTGILASSLADEMRENVAFTPLGSLEEYRVFRGRLLREGGPVGTLPRPGSFGDAAKQAVEAIQGQRPLVLLDKLGERLAFERTGTRLYEALLAKHDQDGSFADGPSADQLRTIRDEELEHFQTLVLMVERMGGDPTAVTPSADIAAVASMGVLQVATDPRIAFRESLDAILIAELVDVEGWKTLVALAHEADDPELLSFATRAEEQEAHHLARVRAWMRARTLAGTRRSEKT
jgi:rubrerythrin